MKNTDKSKNTRKSIYMNIQNIVLVIPPYEKYQRIEKGEKLILINV